MNITLYAGEKDTRISTSLYMAILVYEYQIYYFFIVVKRILRKKLIHFVLNNNTYHQFTLAGSARQNN